MIKCRMAISQNVIFLVVIGIVLILTGVGYWFFSRETNIDGLKVGSGNEFVFSNTDNTFDSIFDQVQDVTDEASGILGCNIQTPQVNIQACDAANMRIKHAVTGKYLNLENSSNGEVIANLNNSGTKIRLGEIIKGEKVFSLRGILNSVERQFFLLAAEDDQNLLGFFDAAFTRSVLDRFILKMDDTNKDLEHVRIIVSPNNRCFTEFCGKFRNAKFYLKPGPNGLNSFSVTTDANDNNTIWKLEKSS